MYVRMYIYAPTCVYLCAYEYTYVCMPIFCRKYIYVCTSIYTFVYIWIYICTLCTPLFVDNTYTMSVLYQNHVDRLGRCDNTYGFPHQTNSGKMWTAHPVHSTSWVPALRSKEKLFVSIKTEYLYYVFCIFTGEFTLIYSYTRRGIIGVVNYRIERF